MRAAARVSRRVAAPWAHDPTAAGTPSSSTSPGVFDNINGPRDPLAGLDFLQRGYLERISRPSEITITGETPDKR